MTTPNIAAGYVRTNDGQFLVQLPADNEWGFVLADDDQTWDGGFGAAESWEPVTAAQVPVAEQERLGWLLEQGE